jgi:photosystem II stability/assembly factor-like uncharacterized protein
MISAPSGDVVWTFVGGSRLFRSIDRGTSWDERGIPAGAQFGEIAFANDHDGLIVRGGTSSTNCQTQQISLWSTHDGALTWAQIAAQGISDSRCKGGPSMIDPTHAVLGSWDDIAAPAVYLSIDGGQTWKMSRSLPDPPGFSSNGAGVVLHLGAVRGFGSTLLVDVNGQKTNGGSQFAYRSADQGATWTYTSTAPLQMPIGFATATRWLQIALSSDAHETTDGGATWHRYTTDYQQAAPVAPLMVFGDANVGYATVRGGLQRTIDGGAHWTPLRTPGTPFP